MKMKSVFMLMAAAVLVSCSKSEIEPAVIGSDEITLGSSILNTNVSSRAPYEATTITAADSLVARVLANVAGTFTGTHYCNGTMTFKSAAAATYNKPVTSGNYDFSGVGVSTPLYLCGLYPAAGWDVTTEAGKASLIFTGKEDVMFAPQVTTTATLVGGGTYGNLAFGHNLTLMKVAFKGDADARTAKTRVVGMKLTKVNGSTITNKVLLDLASTTTTPIAPVYSGAATTFNCYKLGSDSIAFVGTPTGSAAHTVLENTTGTQQAYVIAPPVTASATAGTYEYTFTVDYEVEVGGSFTSRTAVIDVDLMNTTGSTAFAASTVGNAFNLTFNFIGRQITATATVTAWTLGGKVDMDI